MAGATAHLSIVGAIARDLRDVHDIAFLGG
jgi:hypothetical protein